MAQKGDGHQLNWYLGQNTCYFHLQYPLPNLTCMKVASSFKCDDLGSRGLARD